MLYMGEPSVSEKFMDWAPGITVEREEATGEGLKTAVGGKESDNLIPEK